jgi:tetratricopeptide (TPR) repeat protein
MGTVFLGEMVEDRPYAALGTQVAVKTLHPALLHSEESVRRFMREAELGSRVLHPCVVRTFEAGQAQGGDGLTNFLILEYVEGRTLRSLLEEMRLLPEALLRHIALRIARGLQAIHAAGATHRDIKPDNVLITPDQQVKVMDLGIAHVATEATRLTQTGLTVGTLLYSSPEQLGGKGVGPASDLYSLGVVLYEAATGKVPFTGESAAAVAWSHLEDVPERPGALNAAVTPFLEAVILRLLEKRPDRRFSSASELEVVLDRGEESDWWRLRESSAVGEAALRRPRVPIERGTPFVGRAEELRQLEAAYDRASAGEGTVVLLEGDPGAGKTRLLDEFLSRLEANGKGVDVLYGCYLPGGYGRGSDALGQAVTGRFGTAALEQRLTACIPEAAGLVPAFAAHLLGRPAPAGTGPLTAEALSSLYGAVAEALARAGPAIWIVEDTHLASADGRAFLVSLARQLGAWRTLLVLTTETGGAAELAGALLRLPAARALRLDLLSADEVIELVFQKVGRHAVAEELGRRLAARTGGNPFFALASLQDLEERGLLAEVTAPSSRSQAGVAHLAVPASVRELLERRLRAIPEDERPILEVAAVLGYEFDPDLVARVLESKRLQVLQALAVIERRAGLVRAEGTRFRFDHHQLHEVLYESLPEALREEYHALAAAAYRSREGLTGTPASTVPPQAAVILANHLFRSGQWQEAVELALPALAQLMAEYHTGAVLQLADVILERCRDSYAALRCDVQTMRCDALLLLGRNAEALTAAELAVAAGAEVEDRVRLAKAKLRLGRQRMMSGDFDAAREAAAGALELANATGDRATAARAVGDMGLLLHFMGRFADARGCFEEALALARETGERHTVVSALGQLSNLHLALNDLDLAERRSAEQLEACLQAGDRQGHALALMNLGQVAVWKGDYAQAHARYEEQLALSRQIAYRTSETLAHLALSELSFETGQVAEARRHAELGTDMCEIWQVRPVAGYFVLRRGDAAWASGNEPGAATLYEEALAHFRAVHGDQGIAETAFTLGRLTLLRGDRAAARPLLEEARDLARRLQLSVPGPLPEAYLSLLGDAPPALTDAHERGRCSLVAETHLVLHLAGAPGPHAARARELLERMSAHLAGDEARAFWTSYPVARMFEEATAPG